MTKIVTIGILLPDISNETTILVQSTIVASVNYSTSLIFGSMQGGSIGVNPAFPFKNQMGGGFPSFNQGKKGLTQNLGPSISSS